MKQLLLLLSVLYTVSSEAKNYYISAKGLDTNTGLTATTPWQTISKLNASFGIIAAGDSILFKSGENFYGSIIIGKSGTSALPIVISSYGNGAKPVITGFSTLSSWTSIGGGVYQVSAPSVKNTVNMITINDIPQEVGRYPNADAANAGYLKDDLFTGNTQYTCAALNGTNWTGAEVVARKNGYVVERNMISSQSGGTVTYARSFETINPRNANSPSPMTPPNTGFGLFIQRDVRTLDKLGEWYFDPSAKVMKMYFGATNPASYTVKVSTVDTLIDLYNKSYITVNGLDFEGANLAAVYFVDGTNRIITNCTINNSGAKGIFGWYSFNTLIDNNTITNSMCGAIDVRAPANNVTITNNVIKNTGMFQGMSSFYDPADCNAIYLESAGNGIVRKNSIDSTGYIGIHFGGNALAIDSNLINHYCAYRNDGGGIYAYNYPNSNSTIKNNIILNGMESRTGSGEFTDTHGIYMDGGQGGVQILNNTIANVNGTGYGLFFNSPKIITVKNNTVFNANGWYVGRQYTDSIFNFIFKKNIIFNTTPAQSIVLHTHNGLNGSNIPVVSTIQQSLQKLGTVDSNYYNMPYATPFSWYYAPTIGGGFTFPSPVNFSAWKSYTGLDIHSLVVPANTITTQRFEYNATNTVKTIILDSSYIGVDSAIYNTGSVSLQPYTSIILIKTGNLQTNLKADAGTDITLVLPTNSTVLKGSASGSITQYSWQKISGPAQFTIADPNNPSTSISNLSVGIYTFQFKVINSTGDSALATVNVTQTGILPVTLIDFSGKNNNDKISLEWQVASEVNVSHYNIERSSDGQSFENIGQLNSNNLYNIQSNYNFADNFPLQGISYYRLVMIDKDGSIDYSKTVSVSVKNAPSLTLLNIVLSASSANIKTIINSNYQQVTHLVVADVNGRIIFKQPLQLQKGFNAIDKKIPTLKTGVYFAKLFSSNQTITRVLLSEH